MKVQAEQLTESMQNNIDKWVAKFPNGQARSARNGFESRSR